MKIRFFILLLAVGCGVTAAQVPKLNSGPERVLLRGHIVLYDWVAHETTANDDFVVRGTFEGQTGTTNVRVRYQRYWGFDAPKVEAKDVLDRWAFVGRGPLWSFALRKPASPEERAACSSVPPNPTYEHESTKGEIPRFVPTPGADSSTPMDPGTLPCYVLEVGGLKRVNTGTTR